MEDITPTPDVGPSTFYHRCRNLREDRISSGSPLDLRQQKRELRAAMETCRAGAQAKSPSAALHLRDLFLKSIELPEAAVIASYYARGSEMDLAPLTEILHARRQRLALPVVGDKGTPLIFRIYRSGDQLIPGIRGIPEPPPTAPDVEPDILLIPLLAFDQSLARLGYGGGYYDRTLHGLRARKPILALGLAYGVQEVGRVPADSNDAKLDKIVTETQVFSGVNNPLR